MLGLLTAFLVSFIFYKLIGYPLSYDRLFIRNLPLMVLYVLNLIREIVIASFAVMRIIWNPVRKPEPVMIELHSGLDNSFANVLLANSITLTPGTYTVLQEGDRFVIHCLNRDFAIQEEKSSFIRLLRKMHT